MITGGEIKVISQLKIKYITRLNISYMMQEHGICEIEGVLDESNRTMEMLKAIKQMDIVVMSGRDTPLFIGQIREAEISRVNGYYYILVYAVTTSWQMDMAKKKRTFQDVKMTYRDVVSEVMAAYPSGNILYAREAGRAIEEPVIQYGETDWQFLLRLGSHIHVPLYSDHLFGRCGICFGMREGKLVDAEIHNCHVGISRKCYQDRRTGGKERREYLYYRMESDEDYRIGDNVNTKNGVLTIFGKKASIKQDVLIFTYWLGRNGCWYVPLMEHWQLQGVELQGTVERTNKEWVNIRFDMDGAKGGSEYSWNWTPGTGNLMYAMPEKGEKVSVSFGAQTPSAGSAFRSVRKNEEAMPAVQDRELSTMRKKKMELHPEILALRTDGGRIALMDQSRIHAESTFGIQITATGNVNVQASDIRVYTPLEINMYRSEGQCAVRGKNIVPKGTKSNPPTGGGDSGFTMNFEFNGMAKTGILCGTQFIEYRPFQDEPDGDNLEGVFIYSEFTGNVLAGLTVVVAVVAGAAYIGSILVTGGLTATAAPWVMGGLAAFCGTSFVYRQASMDYGNKTLSPTSDYMKGAGIWSYEGAKAGAAVMIVPHAAEGAMNMLETSYMTGVILGNSVYIGYDKIENLLRIGGYGVSLTNSAVVINESLYNFTGKNVLQDVMGENDYQNVKIASALMSQMILELGWNNIVVSGMIDNSMNESNENQIPDNAKRIAKQILNNNGTPPKGYKGGKVYQNNPINGEEKLPEGIEYREYDIYPYVKGQGRGTERIVIGNDGSVWYTNDHYQTFQRME